MSGAGLDQDPRVLTHDVKLPIGVKGAQANIAVRKIPIDQDIGRVPAVRNVELFGALFIVSGLIAETDIS
jgi:hypothetical protein